MTVYTGPCTMPCAEACTVPEGVRVAPVPVPRHDWSDVKVCPNDGCGWALLVLADGQEPPADS